MSLLDKEWKAVVEDDRHEAPVITPLDKEDLIVFLDTLSDMLEEDNPVVKHWTKLEIVRVK